MPKIVFVCTGNTCRSPMAELLLKKMLHERGIEGWRVFSAGISAFPGQTISRNAADVLKDEGIDSSKHLSKELSKEMISEASLLITMTRVHKKIILEEFPEYADKIYTLKECSNSETGDVIDPYGQSHDIYIDTRDDIKESLEGVLGKLAQSKN
ncbi:low molecular weight protein arginine phosphatase [Natronospora cellulosivora (SeqCode)]